MKLISYIFFITFSSLISVNGVRANAVKNFNDQIKSLVDKNYSFYAFKAPYLFYLTGNNRFLKISYEEFINPKNFSKFPEKINPQGIASDIIYYHKEKYKIALRKDKDFYLLEKNKLKKFDPKTISSKFLEK
jgi:hypothetical protein